MIDRVLYLIICAAPPAMNITELVSSAQDQGWHCCCIATPSATHFIDRAQLEALTHLPVRTAYKLPSEPDVFPKPTALLVAPATFNTINKSALGITDTLAAGVICEYLSQCSQVPIVIAPCMKQALLDHPAYTSSLTTLQRCGAVIVHDPIRYPAPAMVPWQQLLDALN